MYIILSETDNCPIWISGRERMVLENNYLSCSTTNLSKWAMRRAKTRISLGIHPVWSVFTVHSKDSQGHKASSWGQRRLWSDWADSQADLSLCWVHRSFCWFYRAATHFISKMWSGWGSNSWALDWSQVTKLTSSYRLQLGEAELH